jgi:uncharacterized protein YjbI with pentapeptide repeats
LDSSVIAWEIDSVSQRLSQLWKGKNLTPGYMLENITLEDASFKGVNFSGKDLSGSILYDASFQDADLMELT